MEQIRMRSDNSSQIPLSFISIYLTVPRNGCGARGHANSFGDAFNLAGGGVYAMLLDQESIRIWHWQNGTVPVDVHGGQPDPSSWGLSMVNFDRASGGCDISRHFSNQTIVSSSGT